MMNNLFEVTLKVSEDTGKGLDPLLKKYVWDRMADPEKLEKRERAITAYYKEIYDKSGNSNVAYDRTDKWASGIFH